MTTSLAALASNPSAHSASTVLMSPNVVSMSSHQQQQQQQHHQLGLSDTGEYDASQDIKSEFYTREGLWKLVKHGEFVRQQQTNVNNNGYQTPMAGGQMNSNVQMQTNNMNNNNNSSGSNEPVNVTYFKYSNDLLFQPPGSQLNSKQHQMQQQQYKNYCAKCMKLNHRTAATNHHQTGNDHDDDDDIVYFNDNNNHSNQDQQQLCCRYCNAKLNSNDSLQSTTNNNISQNNNNNSQVTSHVPPNSISSSSSLNHSLDVVIFNFAREIYFYEFNLFKTKSPSDMRNLIDKKVYRSFISTCFDVNTLASNLNTLDLQNKSVTKTDLSANETNANGAPLSNPTPVNSTSSASSTSSSSSASSSNAGGAITKLNFSPSCLSLILAAGFNKGEIHVFDGFKKEASVFYNNNKLVDKSKVTCIKWLPNSMNLFLAGYSSGNIYLYDANNQTQPNTAPVFTKLYQDESFSLHINNHATSQIQTSSSSNATPSSNSNSSSSNTSTPTTHSTNNNANSSQTTLRSNNSKAMNGHVNSTTSSLSSLDSSGAAKNQEKLILLSANQHQVQVAKNPLLKWTIGASNPATDPSTNEQVFFSNTSSNCVGVNGVNEFAFSPCGSYLAVVSQDGYMRVFSFCYQSNQQMQIQLRCSMKSYFGGLLCCTWSSDGRYIATGGEDDLITVFSFVEMRVACRGRGHSSWINSCSFDPWTCLSSDLNKSTTTTKQTPVTMQNNTQFSSNGNDESDLEEYHASSASDGLKSLSLNSSSRHSFNQNSTPTVEQRKVAISKKNRTISTLSDINYNLNNSTSAAAVSVYYRLASVGQDNQICFWDLTEECLKEKQLPHSRSRLTSFVQQAPPSAATKTSPQLPQIIIQPSELINESNRFVSNTIQQQQHQQNHHQIQPIKEHHQSTTSSIVSTAKSIFSLKHNNNMDTSKSSKSKNSDLADTNPADMLVNANPNANTAATNHKSNGGLLTGNFFKKHKRNASLTNASITNGLSDTASTQNSGSKSGKSSKNNQVTLNSYKKSSNTINLTETIQHISDGVNSSSSGSSSSKKQTSFNEKTLIQSHTNSAFNLCPKLDEIPMIEPLVCKRIATERLNSLVFKEDCFMVSTQDGYVYTWSRPVSSVATNSKNTLPQLHSEFKTNTTTL